MSSDSARQPLYLRSSNHAPAPEDDVFWLALREATASRDEDATAADGREQEPAPAPEDDEFWLALQDETASRINEDENAAAAGPGREIDERVFADLMGYDRSDASSPQKPAERRQGSGSWLQGLASLDDAFAERGGDVDKSAIPGLFSIPGSDSETEPETDSDDESFSSPFASRAAEPARKGVSFSSRVEVKTIPHRSSLSDSQRRRMYNSSVEIHRNRQRNKKEWRYDGCNWRNATEECDMGVDAVTGELVHPAHEHELSFDC